MTSDDLLGSPVLWAFALAIFAVVIVQAALFLRIAIAMRESVGLSRHDIATAARVGGVSAIGPSMAIAFVAIGMLSIFGTPATLMRFGLVGSVPYELLAAQIASDSYGAPLGGEGFDDMAWATVFFIMALGAGMWMLVVLVFTPSMDRLSRRMEQVRPSAATVVPSAALMAAFAFFAFREAAGGVVPLAVLVTSCTTMALLLLLARRGSLAWMKEWALGLAMVAGLLAAGVLA